MELNHLSSLIIKAAIKVHKELGPGLLINFNEVMLKDGITRIINTT
ncbi:MAG: hypothetical protein H8D96_21290 [Desulfobacterales bacterium]|uniref:GxxExxY protein n=1 Tax=Candidatus Desulfatibia vada TaxID=2841696 RepID=A0A8J6TPD7_9BACT|nr:hypothetical protein [Candidatus Desulfatibia vada]